MPSSMTSFTRRLTMALFSSASEGLPSLPTDELLLDVPPRPFESRTRSEMSPPPGSKRPSNEKNGSNPSRKRRSSPASRPSPPLLRTRTRSRCRARGYPRGRKRAFARVLLALLLLLICQLAGCVSSTSCRRAVSNRDPRNPAHPLSGLRFEPCADRTTERSSYRNVTASTIMKTTSHKKASQPMIRGS